MKTKVITLFLILILTLTFSGFSYAIEDNKTTEETNLSQSPNNSSDSNCGDQSNPSYNSGANNSSSSNYITSGSSGSAGSNYIVQQSSNPGLYSASLSNLPSYYDLRTLGRVTAVKDQIPTGTCTIFASIASLESCLLPGEYWDFSENNVKNILSYEYPWGFNRNYYSGGYDADSLAYFARWSGPVNESDDPWNATSGISPENLTVVKHVQNCIFLPGRKNSTDNDLFKSAIVNYGGVESQFIWSTDCINSSSAGYCFIEGSHIAGAHDICLVGWDDNYDKSNFINTPPGNGAFIAKNSYGTEFGDQGYFYISYYDITLGYVNDYFPANLVYLNPERPDNYKQIYQYDPFGMCGSTKASVEGCSTAAFMNVFHATSNNPLAAASFYALAPNTTYNLYAIVNNITTEVAHGVLEYAGYYTIKFNQLIPLVDGQEFKIMVNITSPGCLEPIAIEKQDGWSDKATSNPGESFIYYDGVWTDLTSPIFSDNYPQANLCVKAFTAAASDLKLHVETSNLQPVVGETLKLIISVYNNGPDNAMNVKINDPMPAGLHISSFLTSFGVYNPETGIWDIGELPVGQTASLVIYGTVMAAGELVNEATITSSTYNLNPITIAETVINTHNLPDSTGAPNVKASAIKNVSMQNTGINVFPLALALLFFTCSFWVNRKK